MHLKPKEWALTYKCILESAVNNTSNSNDHYINTDHYVLRLSGKSRIPSGFIMEMKSMGREWDLIWEDHQKLRECGRSNSTNGTKDDILWKNKAEWERNLGSKVETVPNLNKDPLLVYF